VPLIASVGMGSVVLAQDPMDHTAHHGTASQEIQRPTMDGCPMMRGMRGQSMQGMRGQGMRGPGMMQSGVTQDGKAGLFGSHVTPMMNLSAEDVRGYLIVKLDRLNNKRLKVGEIKVDDGTITAEVVTVDNSLVQRLKVDRHTGAIDYQD
jgi:hypothetical protein